CTILTYYDDSGFYMGGLEAW
nr:immunoglobulin heavy chain junction region [Macaca mulatta]MOV50951.1 immunoglobulin heavy chain junction region [Macaca mulatta]MOV51099.1 immunoglobulin heavy chain junction region [Macaca mulatta]MOV51345.1 immunoglobulin heavy chain junction region [Macaca mulatta]MOV52548.1 immunoglobulin heavy chain junction region [Macaca mulatta]